MNSARDEYLKKNMIFLYISILPRPSLIYDQIVHKEVSFFYSKEKRKIYADLQLFFGFFTHFCVKFMLKLEFRVMKSRHIIS